MLTEDAISPVLPLGCRLAVTSGRNQVLLFHDGEADRVVGIPLLSTLHRDTMVLDGLGEWGGDIDVGHDEW